MKREAPAVGLFIWRPSAASPQQRFGPALSPAAAGFGIAISGTSALISVDTEELLPSYSSGIIKRGDYSLALASCFSVWWQYILDLAEQMTRRRMASNTQQPGPAYVTRNPAAISPSSQKPSSTSVKGFTICTQKLPILKSEPIEEMSKNLEITPPEMIFGDNFVTIEHKKSGWGLGFNAFDALDRVDKTGASMLKVAYSREWQKSRWEISCLQRCRS